MFFLTVMIIFFVGQEARGQKEIDLNTLLTKHEAFLKKAETPPLQSRSIEGTVEMKVLVGGSADLGGTAEMISDETHRLLTMKFGHAAYDHEKIVCDRDKISVDLVNSSRRSDLGLFLLSQDQLFKEGLFGGVLSATWPLGGNSNKRGKMKYEGLKKIDGRELHAVTYQTQKKSGDVEITLFFDPETYRHVRTVYTLSIRAGIVGGGETLSARQQVSRVRLEEDFDDFRNSDGYAVPAKWKIKLTTEAQQSRIWEWLVTVSKVTNNAAIEKAQFDVK